MLLISGLWGTITTMAHTFSNVVLHVVFGTKNRTPSLDAEIKPRLFAYVAGIVNEIGGKALVINGTSDHVHLLITLPPTIAISDAMRVVKANSSKWVNEQWPSRAAFAWQSGYAVFSVSQSNCDSVVKYIAGQEEHHRKVTFRGEYLAFLKKHGIPHDERYVWE
jgi:REP element-mobilizing transposase RayT